MTEKEDASDPEPSESTADPKPDALPPLPTYNIHGNKADGFDTFVKMNSPGNLHASGNHLSNGRIGFQLGSDPEITDEAIALIGAKLDELSETDQLRIHAELEKAKRTTAQSTRRAVLQVVYDIAIATTATQLQAMLAGYLV